ncbi:MAG: hypothetical protein RLZZ416_629 [Candidatus Parcubacteria bacterium]|jgi:hypothetical protein
MNTQATKHEMKNRRSSSSKDKNKNGHVDLTHPTHVCVINGGSPLDSIVHRLARSVDERKA